MGYNKCHFPDLHNIHENSAESVGPKYSIVNLLKIQTYDHFHANIIIGLKDEHFCRNVMHLELLEN